MSVGVRRLQFMSVTRLVSKTTGLLKLNAPSNMAASSREQGTHDLSCKIAAQTLPSCAPLFFSLPRTTVKENTSHKSTPAIRVHFYVKAQRAHTNASMAQGLHSKFVTWLVSKGTSPLNADAPENITACAPAGSGHSITPSLLRDASPRTTITKSRRSTEVKHTTREQQRVHARRMHCAAWRLHVMENTLLVSQYKGWSKEALSRNMPAPTQRAASDLLAGLEGRQDREGGEGGKAVEGRLG